MHSSVGRRNAWDCSEDELEIEELWDPEPFGVMLPAEEELASRRDM